MIGERPDRGHMMRPKESLGLRYLAERENPDRELTLRVERRYDLFENAVKKTLKKDPFLVTHGGQQAL